MWKRCGSGKPQQNAAASAAKSFAEGPERQNCSRPQQVLALYKQEVARSSRAPPILPGNSPTRNRLWFQRLWRFPRRLSVASWLIPPLRDLRGRVWRSDVGHQILGCRG